MTEFAPGGLTFSSTFKSIYSINTPSSVQLSPPNGALILGEDGNRYFIGNNTSSLTLIDADTGGSIALTRTAAQMFSDANTAGVTPPGGWVGSGSFGGVGAFAVPNTPYIVVIFGSSSGVTTSKGIFYYKVNSGGSLEFVGGYAGKSDTPLAGVQFSPKNNSGNYMACGHITQQSTSGSNTDVEYKYPIAVAYFGENDSRLFVVPSINYILANTPFVENVTGAWRSRQLDLSGTSFGSNIFEVDASAPGSGNRMRGFFLPTVDGSGNGTGALFAQMFYRADLDEHDAGTASPSNSYLTTYASTYLTGLISSIPVTLPSDATNWGWSPALGGITVNKHVDFRDDSLSAAFPFPDDGENFDTTAGSVTDNYYGNPSVFPSDPTDLTEPWLLFFPRFYRKSGDTDKFGVRVFSWDPATEKAKLLDFAKGQVYTLVTDVPSTVDVDQASIHWEHSDGTLTLALRSNESGTTRTIITEFGTFSPVVQGSSSTGETIAEEFRQRAWGFKLDGHPFYVLRLGMEGTFIYDKLTQQWSQWKTSGYDIWNAEFGVQGWNKNVAVAGDFTEPKLWIVDPTVSLDQGSLSIVREVTGGIPLRGRITSKCDAVRITASVGYPEVGGATVELRFSDDNGQTYSSYSSITLTDSDYSQELAWRSLGTMSAPGRVFEIRDTGGLVRIDTCTAVIDGEDG